MYAEAKQVLNEMAEENMRAQLPYGLEGEGKERDFFES